MKGIVVAVALTLAVMAPIVIHMQKPGAGASYAPASAMGGLHSSGEGGTNEITYVGPDANIWVIGLDGGAPRQLTTDGDNSSPAWSPDGQSIVFVHSNIEVHLMQADGSNRHVVLSPVSNPLYEVYSSYAWLDNVRWTPDDCTLYYTASYGSVIGHVIRSFSICDDSLEEGAGWSDSDDPGYSTGGWYFTWSFDVSLLDGSIANAFWSNADGRYHLELVADGEVVREFLPEGLWEDTHASASCPAFSGDGVQLAYSSSSPDGVVVVNIDGSPSTTLPVNGCSITWSPDSGSLAYQSDGQIWVVSLADGASRAIAEGSQPAWSRGAPSVVGEWNHTCYLGPEQSIEQALGDAADDVLAVYRLNASQTFDRWFTDRPEVSNIETIKPYEPLFVLMSKDAAWSQTPSGTPPNSATLAQGWNSTCYLGQTMAAGDATESIASQLGMLYVLGTDQAWSRYVPGRPEVSNIAQLAQYDAVLLLVGAEDGAQWVFNP